MVVHSVRQQANKHARRYNGSETSEVAAIILEAEDGINGGQEIVLKKRVNLDAHGNKVFDTIPVTNRFFDP